MVHSLEPRFGWHSRGCLPHFDSFVRNQKIGPLAVLGFELDHCITAAAARKMRANRPQGCGRSCGALQLRKIRARLQHHTLNHNLI